MRGLLATLTAVTLLYACSSPPEPLSWRAVGTDYLVSDAGDSTPMPVIEISSGRARDTIRRVLEPAPVLVGDSVLIGIRTDSGWAQRQFFRYSSHTRRLQRFPLPSDVMFYFHDVAVSPDGRFVAYVGADTVGWESAVVRPWPDGAVLVRGARTPVCECDLDLHHAHWVSADSFEIATKLTSTQWQRVAGSPSHRSVHVDTIPEPNWHPEH